jgi:ABC-type multidrug transport system fused ATPase/permease subunit
MTTPIETLKRQTRGIQMSFSTIIRFRRELLAHWPRLTIALICTLGYTAMRLAEPWPLKFIFDNVLVNQPLVTPSPWVNETIGTDRMRILYTAAGALLLFALFRGIFYYFQSVLTSYVGQEVVIRIRRQLFAHLQRLSLRFHNESSTGDLLTRLTGDINNLRQLLAASLLSLISEGILLISFLVVMFVMNWRLALLAVITMPVIFVLVTFYSSRIRQASRKQRRREGELASRMHENLSGIHVVQLFARERHEDAQLRGLNKRSLRAGLKSTKLEGKMNQGIEISVAIGMALTLCFGATEVIAGRLSAGGLLVFVTYMQSFYRAALARRGAGKQGGELRRPDYRYSRRGVRDQGRYGQGATLQGRDRLFQRLFSVQERSAGAERYRPDDSHWPDRRPGRSIRGGQVDAGLDGLPALRSDGRDCIDRWHGHPGFHPDLAA